MGHSSTYPLSYASSLPVYPSPTPYPTPDLDSQFDQQPAPIQSPPCGPEPETITAPNSPTLMPSSALPTEELKRLAPAYLEECELRFLSPRTIETRRVFIRNLLWFLEKRGYTECGTGELRQFFSYLMHGHEEAGGRFGQKQLNRPVRPITLKDYDTCLRALFDWLKRIGVLEETPFAGIPKPHVQEGRKEPLSPDQIAALLAAAAGSNYPQRDIALLSFLLDTGCRASEVIALQLFDLDLTNRCCTVLGKGNKYRTVYFGETTTRALHEYLAATATLRTTLQPKGIQIAAMQSATTQSPTLSPVEPEPTGLQLAGYPWGQGEVVETGTGLQEHSELQEQSEPQAKKRVRQRPRQGHLQEANPLFLSEWSQVTQKREPLTRSGLLQLMERLGRKCGIPVSCSPHALRRSFAVQTLRNGANVFSVQAMLGHTNLQMTQKYCAIALSDVEAQHRQFGPLDRMTSPLPSLSGKKL